MVVFGGEGDAVGYWGWWLGRSCGVGVGSGCWQWQCVVKRSSLIAVLIAVLSTFDPSPRSFTLTPPPLPPHPALPAPTPPHSHPTPPRHHQAVSRNGRPRHPPQIRQPRPELHPHPPPHQGTCKLTLSTRTMRHVEKPFTLNIRVPLKCCAILS